MANDSAPQDLTTTIDKWLFVFLNQRQILTVWPVLTVCSTPALPDFTYIAEQILSTALAPRDKYSRPETNELVLSHDFVALHYKLAGGSLLLVSPK